MESSTAERQFGSILPQQDSGTSTPVARKTRAAQKKLNGNKLDMASESVLDDDVFGAPPKTPSASVRPSSETPRRSSRKSVRPPLDYKDIIEKRVTCSTSSEQAPEEDNPVPKWVPAEVGRHTRKRNHSKSKRAAIKQARIEENGEGLAEEEKAVNDGEPESVLNPSFNAYENASDGENMPVAEKEEKIEEQEKAAEVKEAKKEEQQQLAAAVTTTVEPQSQGQDKHESKLPDKVTDETFEKATDEIDADMDKLGFCPLEAEEQSNENDKMPSLIMFDDGETETELNLTFDADENASDEENMPAEKAQSESSANKKAKSSPMQKKEQESKVVKEKKAKEEKQQQLAAAKTAAGEPQPQGQDKHEPKLPDEVLNETFELATDAEKLTLQLSSPVVEGTAPAAELSVAAKGQRPDIATDADMDELGLCPLEADEPANEDDEMPSLIMIDDGEPENVVNLTSDADENASDGENMDALRVTEQQEHSDSDIDIKAKNKANAYRFPTPYKCKSTPKFKFAETPAAASNNQNLEVACTKRRKRSKSVSGLNETKVKTVSFFSPIEVAIVNDIDKRWEGLNNSHITQRRKRSKSLDESRHQVSRIPKPKPYPPVRAAVTPSKQKPRTKLPNFAAIHQKQFEKMENLVDHMERKAVRAKVLTNSATKLQKQQKATIASAQKASAKKMPGLEVARPRAVKKIAESSYTMTPIKPDDQKRQKQLPTPRKIVAVAHSKSVAPTRALQAANNLKPAFNLSTSVAFKMFIPAASATAGNKQEEEIKNKVETRRQRHMDMFKGHAAPKQRSDFIRGVRSNRRFELQMQHRKQLDENAG